MIVELMRYTPDGEKLVAAAAKLCYSPSSIKEIEEGLSDSNIEKFLTHLMDLNHESPIEHISFTFAVEGVSRTLTHQLVRHRLASFSQQSQRYVKEDLFEYITPPTIGDNHQAKEIFEQHMQASQEVYDGLVDLLYSNKYEEFFDGGMSHTAAHSKAEKEAIEDARYVFPNATETKIVLTMNARTLLNFFRLRCCNRAQWEIRELAIEMLRQVKEIYPILFKNSGPGCAHGPCPEGNMTCGKIVEVREFFKNL